MHGRRVHQKLDIEFWTEGYPQSISEHDRKKVGVMGLLYLSLLVFSQIHWAIFYTSDAWVLEKR